MSGDTKQDVFDSIDDVRFSLDMLREDLDILGPIDEDEALRHARNARVSVKELVEVLESYLKS